MDGVSDAKPETVKNVWMGKRRGGELARPPRSAGKQRLLGRSHPEVISSPPLLAQGLIPGWDRDEDRTAGLLASGSFASFPAFPLQWFEAVACGVERSVARHSGATAAELSLWLVGGTHGIPYSPQQRAGAPFDQSLRASARLATAANRRSIGATIDKNRRVGRIAQREFSAYWEQFVARQALNNTETPPFARHRLHRSHYQATTYQKNYRNESTGDHVSLHHDCRRWAGNF